MTIETERLLLRPYREEDFEAVHSYSCNPMVVRYTLWGPNTEQETREFLQRTIAFSNAEPRMDYGFAIALKESDQLVGGCGLMLRSFANKNGEVGYCLHPDFWGKGYVPEAVGGLLKFAFESLGLHRIYARCHRDNIASARVMQKIGMTYEGCLRDSEFAKERWWDFIHYSILEQEWKSR